MMCGVIYSSNSVPKLEQLQSAIVENGYPCTLEEFEISESEILFTGSLVGVPIQLICTHSLISDTYFDLFDIESFGGAHDRCFGRCGSDPYSDGLYLFWSYVSSTFCKVCDALMWQDDFDTPNSLEFEADRRRGPLDNYLLSLYFYEVARGGISENPILAKTCTDSWLEFMWGALGDKYKSGFLGLKDEGSPVYEDGRCVVHKMYEISTQGFQQVQSMLEGMKHSA